MDHQLFKNEQDKLLTQNNITSQFICNQCKQLAQQPVVAECGHLFCWHCVHDNNKCVVCNKQLIECEFIPIYTSHQNRGTKINKLVKPKPKAKNIQKIKNKSCVVPTNSLPGALNLNDNIQRQITIAGMGYCPSTIFISLGNHDQQQFEEMKQTSQIIKNRVFNIFWFMLIVVIICLYLGLGQYETNR